MAEFDRRADAQEPLRGPHRRPRPLRAQQAGAGGSRTPADHLWHGWCSAPWCSGASSPPLTKPRENVGVLLPNVQGLAVALFGLNAFGRVPALLNFTAGTKNLKAACEVARIDTIVTSRRFVEQGKLDDVLAAIAEGRKVVFLEDVRKRDHQPRQGAGPRRELVRARRPQARGRAAGRSGRRAVHLRLGGQAEGRRPVERQSGRQRLSGEGPCGRRADRRRRVLQSAADLPFLRPHRGPSDLAAQRHQGGALSEPAALPADPEAHRGHEIHHPARHRHLSAGLCPGRRSGRSRSGALRHRRAPSA